MRHGISVSPEEGITALPAYLRIKNFVFKKIQDGVWREGDLIPTELALCDTFGVSRMTVNRALRELASEQLIVRYKGSGTYVTGPKFQSTLIEIRSIAHDIRDRGHTHTSKVLKLSTVRASELQAEQFKLKSGAVLFHSVMVHYDNEVAIQLEDRLVDASIAPDYLDQDWRAITPNEYLMRVAPLPTGHYTIDVRLPTRNIAKPLDIPVSQHCLVMERMTFSNQAFTTHVTLWHPGNRYKFAGKI